MFLQFVFFVCVDDMTEQMVLISSEKQYFYIWKEAVFPTVWAMLC